MQLNVHSLHLAQPRVLPDSKFDRERHIGGIDLSLAGDVREPASELDAEFRAERQDRCRRIPAQAQADSERFGADVARLHRGRVVDPALRGGAEDVWRDRASALRPAELVGPLDLAAQRRALVDAERAERIGGCGLQTIERELLGNESGWPKLVCAWPMSAPCKS